MPRCCDVRQFTERGLKRRRLKLGRVTVAEESTGCRDDGRRDIWSVNEFCDLGCENALSLPLERFCHDRDGKLLNAGSTEEREHFEALDDVPVVGIEPELIHPVRAAQGGIQPDRITLAVLKLGTVRVRDERGSERVNGRSLDAVDKIGATCEIAPLVTAAGLQHAPERTGKLKEIKPLQDLVTELGVANARVRSEAGRDRVLLEHRANAVVLSNLAEKVNGREPDSPHQIVHETQGVTATFRKKATHLLLKVPCPFGDSFVRVEGALSGRTRIPNEPRRAANQTKRVVTG